VTTADFTRLDEATATTTDRYELDRVDKGGGYKLYEVNVPMWDRAWKASEPSQYVGRGGAGGIGGRYERFRQWLAGEPLQVTKTRTLLGRAPGGRIIAPTCGVLEGSRGPNVYFDNGRHRYAVMRDAGERVVVALRAPDAARAREHRLIGRTVPEDAA